MKEALESWRMDKGVRIESESSGNSAEDSCGKTGEQDRQTPETGVEQRKGEQQQKV